MRFVNNVFLLIAALFFSIQAMSTSYVWYPTTAGTYNWNDLSNWRVAGVAPTVLPGSADAVTINSPSGVQIINLPGTSLILTSIAITTTAVTAGITLSASGPYTFTLSGTMKISSPASATGTFESNYSIEYVAAGSMTISNARINYPLRTTCNVMTITNSVFGNTCDLNISGVSASNCGGNTYNGSLKLTTTPASGQFVTMGSNNPDIYNNTVDIYRNGGSIYMSHSSSDNIYTNTITIYSTGTVNGGIFFGGSGGTSTFSGSATINGTLDVGYLTAKNITKTTTLSSTVTATTGNITYGPGIDMKGGVNLKAPIINLIGGADYFQPGTNIFRDAVSLEYSGLITTNSYGGNTFKNGLTITCSGNNDGSSTNYDLYFTASYQDLVQGLLTVNLNMYGRHLYLGKGKIMKVTGTDADPTSGGVVVNYAKKSGLYLGYDAASGFQMSNLLSFTSTTFNDGTLVFSRFSHIESTSVPDTRVTIAGGSASSVTMNTNNTFSSGVSISAAALDISSAVFNENTLFEAVNGTSISQLRGACTFAKNVTCRAINGSSSIGNFTIAGSAGVVTVQGDMVLELAGNGSRAFLVCGGNSVTVGNDFYFRHGGGSVNSYIAYNGACTVNGNIYVSKNSDGIGGIILGNYGTLSHNGGAVKIEPGNSFYNGGLTFNRYVQTNQSLQTTAEGVNFITPATIPSSVIPGGAVNNVAVVVLNASSFFSSVVLTAYNVSIRGGIFKNTATFTYTIGTFSNNNDFYGTTTFNYLGTTGLTLFSGSINNYYGDLFYNCLNAGGYMYMGSSTSTFNFYKNYTYTASNINVSYISGADNFLGTTDQYLYYTPSSESFQHLTINKPSGKLYVQKDIIIAGNTNFTNGIVVVPSTNAATFFNSSVVQSQGLTSYIDGKATRNGNVAFTFPIGKGIYYRPLAISAPANTATSITVEYFPVMHASLPTAVLPSTMPDLSAASYWNLSCSNTYSSSIAVTLPWNINTIEPISKSAMAVGKYIGTTWSDAGNASSTGDNTTGSVTGNTSAAFVATYALGYKSAVVLNLLNVYVAKYKTSGPNIDFIRNYTSGIPVDFICTSGSAPVLPITATKLGGQNISQKLVVHPAPGTTCAEIDILTDVSTVNFTPLSLCLSTDASGNVNGMQTSAANTVSTDYYSYSSTTKELIIYPNKKPDGSISIANNLLNGTIWKKTSNPTLTFTVGGNIFAYAHLKVTDASGTVKYDSDLSGTFSYAGSSLNWAGTAITTDGLYIYQLSIGTSSSTAKVYSGNMLVKVSE